MAIWAAGWAAHGGCLHAVFFLDDWGQIVHFTPVHADDSYGGRPLTTLLFTVEYWLGNTAWIHHLGNLLLHLLLATLIFALGPIFFDWGTDVVSRHRARLAAFFGALVFVVHPLCSEVTHYARAVDHGLIGFFSFLTAAGTLLWLRRGWRWAPLAVGAAILDILSKGPGPAHALLAVVAVIGCYGWNPETRRRIFSRWTLYALLIVPLALLAFWPEAVLGWSSVILDEDRSHHFFLHALTQSRVDWQYLWRMACPLGLCPDHLIAWTKSWRDPVPWIALAGLAGWMGGVAWLWRSGQWGRAMAFLLFMIVANLLLRWGYVVSELMVEYRAYPSMPWLGQLAGWGLLRLWEWRKGAAYAALALVLAAGIGLTRQRSSVWSSSARLTASIEEQYPWQLRVVMERTNDEAQRGDAAAALQELPSFYQRLGEVIAYNRDSTTRYYENWPLWAVTVECNVADALIRAGRLPEARAMLEKTGRNMKANRIDQGGILSDDWNFEMAKLENRSGHYLLAEFHLRKMPGWAYDPAAYREELATAQKGLGK